MMEVDTKMMEVASDQNDASSLPPLKRSFPWNKFISTFLFVAASALYLAMTVMDLKWVRVYRSLPMYVRTADDDATWTNYRLGESYNASLEAEEQASPEESDGGLYRWLQSEDNETSVETQADPAKNRTVITVSYNATNGTEVSVVSASVFDMGDTVELEAWDGMDTEANVSAGDDYVSYEDDYVFVVNVRGGVWVTRYQILYFVASLCFVGTGVLDLIREKHPFHILMIIAGVTGFVSALYIVQNYHLSNIFNCISVHFFALEAFTLYGYHKRASITATDAEKWILYSLAFGDLNFLGGALIDVVLSYFYLYYQSVDWNLPVVAFAIIASIMWLISSLVYMVAFWYEYLTMKDLDVIFEGVTKEDNLEKGKHHHKIDAELKAGTDRTADESATNGEHIPMDLTKDGEFELKFEPQPGPSDQLC